MAKQSGLMPVEGTIGELNFYKRNGKYFIRRKGGVSAERIANDPSFERTRENGTEFSEIGKATKMLRDAIRPVLRNASDNTSSTRLVRIMAAIKNLDSTSARGRRNVATGLMNPAAKNLLRGFDFNITALMSSTIFKPLQVVTTTGDINIQNFFPLVDLNFPRAATHVAMRAAWGRVDFTTGQSEYFESPAFNMAAGAAAANVTLKPGGAPSGPGNDFYLFKLEFFQEINGIQYPLKNDVYNVLTIVEVI